jgi:hypothetical protein
MVIYVLELDFVLFFENCDYEFKNHLYNHFNSL